MSKYTPGPWETLAYISHEQQTDFILVKIGRRVHMVGYSDEDKANARLIAAAPELLEALEAILEDAFGGMDTLARIQAAEAAIAKAKGEI